MKPSAPFHGWLSVVPGWQTGAKVSSVLQACRRALLSDDSLEPVAGH